MLIEDFDGEVPRTLDELTRLPGVARKTANVVASELGDTSGRRRRHARAAPLAAARLHEAGRPGQDRARPAAPRAARVLGRLPASAHLARPACLHRAPSTLRGMCADRPLPVYARRARATINPPSSSYAGKKSAVTGWVRPFRVRSSSFSPKRRTPHSRESSDGFLPSSQPDSRRPPSRPFRARPSPGSRSARRRRGRARGSAPRASQTTKPALGAG